MTRSLVPSALFLALCSVPWLTGCGTTLVLSPMFSPGEKGSSGVMMAVEQRAWGIGSKDERMGLVAKSGFMGGFTSTHGVYTGANVGASYVYVFRSPTEYESYRAYEESAGPYASSTRKSPAHGFFSMGLSGGYLYGGRQGGALLALLPEFDFGMKVISWTERTLLVGIRAHCMRAHESSSCGPGVTLTLLPVTF